MKKPIKGALGLFVCVFLLAGICYGQGATATITGTVTDPQGAVVPNATVTAHNVDTGIDRVTKTTSDGLYRFDSLVPGVYNISAESTGFQKAVASAVKLQVGEQRDVNFSLIITGASEKVEVSATPLVETTKTDVSSVVDDKQVANLPTTTSFNGIGGVSNDFAGLAALAPGVKYDFTSVSSDLVGPGAVNNRSIQVNVDGGNISDQVVSARDALGASVEEVREFQVLTNNYNAEYGQAGGIILNVITKSGTNEFHGDGHYYTRGRNLAASNFFYNQEPDAQFRRAPFHKYEGGFTAGGPFVKDKTFWFVSFENTHQAVPLTLTPPSGTTTISQPTLELLWSAKVDHQINEKNHISARYNVQRDLQDDLLVQIGNFASPDSLVSSVVHDGNLNAAWTSTPTTTTVNEFRFFWHRFLSQTPTKSESPGLSGPNFYQGAAFCCPQGALQNRYQFVDNFSWTHGAHTVKVGYNISHFPYFSLFTQIHDGEYLYSQAEPFGATGPVGSPSLFQIGLGPAQVNAGDNIYGFYGQDTWKVRPNLTLNYGLRYDVEAGAFQGGTIKASVPGGCVQANGIIPACSSDHNNFQPRLGIAWSPNFRSGFLHSVFGDQDRTVIRLSFAEITELAYLNVVLDSLNFDGVNLLTVSSADPNVLKYAPGLPPQSVLNSLRPQGFFGRVRPISNTLRNPETRHVNLTITRQLGKNTVLDLTYLGVYGFGLFGERDTNYPAILPDARHPGFFYFGNIPDPRFTAIRTNENSRTSAYQGLLVHISKRLSHHFQVQGSYTFSKLLASTEDFFGVSEPGDPNNIAADRSLAQLNARHQASFSVVADTTNATSRPVVKYFVNNWTLGFIGQLQSGRPYPVSSGDAPFSGGAFFGIGNETQQRPNVLPDGTLVVTNIANGQFGTNLLVGPNGSASCHCPQTTFLAPAGANPSGPIDTFTGDIVDFQFINGDLVRNAGTSSPYYRFDTSFIKAFRIVPSREQMRLEFKVDIFNIFNRANFLLNNTNDDLNILPVSTDPNCRSCLNAHTGRFIGSDGRVLTIHDLQSGRVSKDLQTPIFGGIGDPALTDLPRTIQLSVRFRW